MGWAALSGIEVAEAARVCHACADTPARAFQSIAAYLYIVSLRSNITATAKATDADVASAIPKTRGSGAVGLDAYRKQIKPLLVAWGLLSCSLQRPTGKGRQPTLYGFPMFEKLIDGIEPTGQDTCDMSDYPPFA
ncbi:hypothetical protein [Gordonibacter sp.]|uniref:hypothetical protein n=1 Tax=Gordonibacter sp. TaxID=1968902 RepID=UPI002FCBA7DE